MTVIYILVLLQQQACCITSTQWFF